MWKKGTLLYNQCEQNIVEMKTHLGTCEMSPTLKKNLIVSSILNLLTHLRVTLMSYQYYIHTDFQGKKHDPKCLLHQHAIITLQ